MRSSPRPFRSCIRVADLRKRCEYDTLITTIEGDSRMCKDVTANQLVEVRHALLHSGPRTFTYPIGFAEEAAANMAAAPGSA